MNAENTLLIVAFSLGSLKLVDYYKHILDTKDVSDVSINYTILGLVSSIIWLYLTIKSKTTSNVIAGMITITIAMELYVLYILLEREIKFNSLETKKINGEEEENEIN